MTDQRDPIADAVAQARPVEPPPWEEERAHDAPQPHDEGDGEDPRFDEAQAAGVDPKIVEACAGLEQNDTDNGRRLMLHFGDNLQHVREIGWHAWDGLRWDMEGGQESIERAAQATAKRIKLEPFHMEPLPAEAAAIRAGAPLQKRDLDSLTEGEKVVRLAADSAAARFAQRKSDRRKFAISCGNRGRTVAMIAQALPHKSVPPAALDADPMLFNLASGTLRFVVTKTRVPDPDAPAQDMDAVHVDVQHQPHDRGALISKLAPWHYDPAARAPRWLAWLEEFVPDPLTRDFLQAAVGRAMLGGSSTQVLIFLYGDGANGKSLFMEVIARLLGSYTGRLKPESISGHDQQSGDKATPDFARLHRTRLLIIEELPRGAPLKEALVKTMTGGTAIPVRHLQKGFFDLVPEFIPFMSGNDKPDIGGLDHGIWRRIKIVHFPITIDEARRRQLPDVVAEFMTEAPGILNWAIDGARRFLAEGLIDPPEVTRTTREHRADLDPVAAFVRDCVEFAEGEEVQARAAYLAFDAYCAANAIRPWKEKMFSVAMKKKGFQREDKRIRRWLDIRLHDVPEHPDRPAARYG